MKFEMMMKRIVSMLLVVVMVISVLPLSALAEPLAAIDPDTATEEELVHHQTELFEVADQAGFAAEYELFYAVLEDMDDNGDFYNYNNFALYCRSMSDETLLELLGYVRKYVNAGAKAGYSAVSATEEFFDDWMYNIYYTYFEREEYMGVIRSEDLKQFENTPMFIQNLPAYYYYPTEADLPNELELTVELSPALMAAMDENGGHWIAATGGHYTHNLLENNTDVDMESVGNRETLRLSADDILKFAANDENNFYTSTGGFWVRYYAGGYLSDPCYIAIGTTAYLEGSPSYGSREQGRFTLDFNTDRLPEGAEVIYQWNLSPAVPEWVLQGTFEDSTWDGPFTTTEPVLTIEDIEDYPYFGYPGDSDTITAEDAWNRTNYLSCQVIWRVEGEEYRLNTPILPVFGGESGEVGPDRSWTYSPISTFEVFGSSTYVEPGTAITSNAFTLADDTEIDCTLYYNEFIDGENVRVVISDQGMTFTIPESEDARRPHTEYSVSYCATAPNGKTYSGGLVRELNVYPEDLLVYTGYGSSDGILGEKILYKDVAKSTANTNIFALEPMALYQNGILYSTGSSYSATKLKVNWYTNTVKSYEGATLHSTGKTAFQTKPNTVGEYYVYCVLSAGDFSYTSEIFTYNVIDPAALTENRYLITSDGTLYCVFSNDEVVTIPETINGITVKTIAGDTFGSAGYGIYAYDRSPKMTTLILPDTVETLESGAVPHCVTTLKLGDGIKHIEGLPNSIEKLVIPEGVETLNVPKVSVLEIQSPKTIEILNQTGKRIEVGTLILPEGLEIIGKGGLECAVTADVVVLPSTLKVFAPVKSFYVNEKIELPEGLEVFDGVQIINEYWDQYQGSETIIDYNFTYEGQTLVFPESLKTLGHLGVLWNVTELKLPEGFIPGEYYFERAGIESYIIPAGMTVIPNGLFKNSGLRAIVIPEGVTEIGAEAFKNCTDLEKIVLPSTLTKIGDKAFQNCEALTELVIPTSVKTIGAEAFDGCYGIERVVIPASVTELGEYAFSNCAFLQEVVIEAMLPTLKTGIFAGCSSLCSIQVPDSLQRVNDRAFAGCYGITSLDFLPDSVSFIGSYAFEDAGLEGELVLPAGLQELGGYAFSGTYITSVRFNDRLKYIGEYAFAYTQLTSVVIPDSVTVIGSGAFCYSSLERITFGENVSYIGADAFRGTNLTEYTVPKKVTKLMGGTIAETPITHIDLDPTGEGVLSYVGPCAFEGSGIVSIVFPDSVTYLGKGVCSGCYSLESVVLPGSITRIREDSFYDCDALTTVQMSDQLKRIDGWAFYGCTSLNGIVLPDSLEIIGQSAFCDCTSLEIADLPDSLISVEKFSFRGTKLAKIELGENVTYVGDYAFQDCAEVTSITLNSKLGYIGDYAFDGCVLVTQLKIPESVGNIGDHFIRGTAIEEIVLPSSLSFIPAFTDNTVIKKVTCASTDIQHLWGSTFANCTALEEADVYSGEWIGSNCFLNCTSLKYFHAYYQTKEIRKSAFEGCSSMTLITFGGKDSLLEAIGEKAFSGCEGITAFDLPETLKSIGSRAFEKTSITSIIVPAKVTSIGTTPIYNDLSGTHTGYGDSCFYDCPELQRIAFVDRDGEFLPIYSFAEYCPKLAEVYLPSSVGWMSTKNGFDMEIFGDPSPWLKNYNQAKLEGYVPTAYYRYGVYQSDKDFSDWTFDSIYKPGDTFTVIPFSSDYDAEKAYWEFFNEQVELCKAEGYDPVEFVSLNEYLKPMTVLSSFGVKVMAGDEDITDKVQIDWYINWLEDNVLVSGAKLDGSAYVCDGFRYHFTVTLDEAYAFEYEDYASDEFELKSTMDGQVIVVNLVKREKGAVEIELPEGVKDDPSVSVSVLQTQSNLLRELETEIVDGKITLQAAPSANLLVYVYCKDYYKYIGSVAAEDIQKAIDTDTPHRLTVEMKKLPVSGTFTAKFSIYDLLPEDEEITKQLDSFEGISVEIKNVTKGTICADYTLQFPYVIINNYETFFDLTDELTITVTPDASLEMYGFTTVLNPGDSENYGDTEGTFNMYGAMYIQPTLPKDSESGRAIVQVYNGAGNRVSIDTVDSGELLIRRFADGTYTVTVSEQNRYFNTAERLTQFTTCGWTAGEDYYRTTVTLEAPCCEVLDVEAPLAPDSSFLIKRDPVVTRKDHLYNNWQLYNWPYYTELTFDVELDTSFQLRNTSLLLSVPANMDLYHICQAEQEFGVHMTYTDRYLSDDGLTMYYEYPIGDLTQKEGRLNFMVYLRYNEDIISFDQITEQYCTATIVTDATVDGTAARYYAAAGSITMLDEEMLSYMVNVSHAPTISDKTGITAMVTAPAGSEVDLYADGELVAQGITNYTGMAVLRYDAPFEWLWWEYEVYAVVRIANTGIEFTTDSVSVECNEDLAVPVEIVGEIVIRDAETGAVVFPTSYDPDNIISVNFKTGERKNIVLRSMLDSSDGKLYDIHETFRVTFDNNDAGYARDVAIVNRYTDVYGSEKEEYLWAEYNEDSGRYISKKVIRNVAYDPATLLTVMQLPTHMGVEWETAANAVGITLMPGQMEALAERLNETEVNPLLEVFGVEPSLENTFYAMLDPVETDPLFPYYPAQMQADIISDYQFVQDFDYIMSNAFTEAFGFSIDDMTEEDYFSLMSVTKSETIDESVTAASLRYKGFTEIPVYGEECGVFMANTDAGLEVYDFSSNFYMLYDSESWMEVLDSYIPAAKKQSLRKRTLAAGEAPRDSLSFYVDGIHDKIVAELIDSTYEQYLDNKDYFDNVVSKGLTDLLSAISESFDDGAMDWFDYFLGSKNPTLNGLNNLIGKGMSLISDAIPLDWNWRENGLINDYYNSAGEPCVELTDAGYNYLRDSDLNYVSSVLKEAESAYNLSAKTGQMLTQGISNAMMKGYKINETGTQKLINQAFGTTARGSLNSVTMDIDLFNKSQDIISKGVADGIIKTHVVQMPNGEKLVAKIESNIKGIGHSEALALVAGSHDSQGVEIENTAYRMMHFKNAASGKIDALKNDIKNSKIASFSGKANKILTKVVGAADAVKLVSQQAEALDKMRDAYKGYVDEMLNLGQKYAAVDKIIQATINRDEENMESFYIYPLYQSNMMKKYGFGSIAVDEYESREVFNMLFEGQAFVWMPFWEGYNDPELGPVITGKHYSRSTVYGYMRAMGGFLGTSGADFQDPEMYYHDVSPEYFTCLMDVQDSIVRTMFDLQKLCNQFDIESKIEGSHVITKLLGLTAHIPVPLVNKIVSTGQYAVDKVIDMGAVISNYAYARVYDKFNKNRYIQTNFQRVDTFNKLYELKRDLSTKGDDGNGVWTIDGVRYVSAEKAFNLWEEMVEDNYYYFKWYPSGLEDGLHWEDDPTRVEVADEIIFTEEEAIKISLEETAGEMTSFEMECSDPLIDPAGYIYEAVLSNRVEGATAKIYYQDENGNAVLWDAENYGQVSTIITEAGGYYSWLTPPGNWKVVVQKDGYLTADSTKDTNAVDGWLPVPPPQLDVNIGLVTTVAPTVTNADGYAEGVLVQFSQYMDIESFNGAVTLMVDGETVPCVLTFTDKEVSATDAGVYYGRKLMVSRQDGQPLIGTVKVAIAGSVKNYAGIALGTAYTSETLTVKQYVSQIDMTYTNITVKAAEKATLEGRLLDAFGNPVAGRRVILSSDETHADLLNEIVYTDQNGYFTFNVEGKDIGFTVVDICPDDSAVCAQVTIETQRINHLNKHTAAKSESPVVTVVDPDGDYSTVQITESGVLKVQEGSKLMISGLGSGEIGYSTMDADLDPWKCEDYTIFELPITAEEKTYRIVYLEEGKAYSEVLELRVLFAETHVHSLVLVPAREATCCTYGNIAHYSCSRCGMLFEDAAGTMEITDANAVWISAYGHEEPAYTINGDTHSVDYSCCDLLDYTDREHKYVDHVCVCGAVETFTVTFKYSNDVLWQTEYPYNTILKIADIAIPDSPGDIYVWGGWHDANGNPLVDGTAVTSDLTFYAYWNYVTYTVTWIVGDNRFTEVYEYGSWPYFKGSTDKEADGCIVYTFTGWDQEPDYVDGDVTYTAQYQSGYSHTEEYSYVDETYHKIVCSSCDAVLTEEEEHKDNDGYCPCGATSSNVVATVSKNGAIVGAYTDLDDAIWDVYFCAAADEAVVTLMRDIDLGDGDLSIYSGVFTLDLNGHKISSTNTTWGTVYISGASTNVTIQGTDENSKITGVYAAIMCFSATLNINGCIVSAGSYGVNVYDGTLKIDGSTISGNYAVDTNNTTVTVNDSTISGDYALYVSDGTAIIDDSTISGETYGVRSSDSTVIINGGSVTGGSSGVYASNGSVTIGDGTITGDSYGVRTSSTIVTIRGGTISGDRALYAYSGTAEISGGTFRGVTYDIYDLMCSVTLTLGENGVGATFPDGITSYFTTLNDMLGEGAAYWQGDAMVTPSDYAYSLTGGDVVIKAQAAPVYSGWTEIEGNWYYYDPATNEPVTGITRVPYPTSPINGITYAPDQESIDYAASKGQTFIDETTGLFIFDENGVFQSDRNGLTTDDRWAVNGQIPWHVGLVQIGEDYYYFLGDTVNGGNKMVTGDIYANRNNTAFDMVIGGVYTFGVDGKLCKYEGITEVNGVLRYYENCRLMTGNRLTKVGENFIYVRTNGELVVSAEYYVPGNHLGVATGMYAFDASGYMIDPISTDKDGVYLENGEWVYYENGKIGFNKGMMAYNGGYIYVRSNGKLATGTYYVTNVPEALFDLFGRGQKVIFDENGYAEAPKHGIVEKNGELFYYQLGSIAYNAGLIELDDGYIYVRSNGTLATGTYWITNTNGNMKAGCYEFGADGYMIISNDKDGVVEENGALHYYDSGVKLYGAGLVQTDDNRFVYVCSSGQLATGRYWITNTNGIMEAGYYEFGTDGYLIVSDAEGIIEETGVLYYYLDGKKQFGLGLVKLDEHTFIYVRTNGQLAVGAYWVTNHHGLLPETIYEFNEDGTLTVN